MRICEREAGLRRIRKGLPGLTMLDCKNSLVAIPHIQIDDPMADSKRIDASHLGSADSITESGPVCLPAHWRRSGFCVAYQELINQ